MKIALAQMDIHWESKEDNFIKVESYAKEASEKKCDLIVLPEMFATGFSMNVTSIAEDSNGRTFQFLSRLARDFKINVIAGFAKNSENGSKPYNIATVLNSQGALISKYKKIHLFSNANEDKYFDSGTDPEIFQIAKLNASVFICYDLRFPELFRPVARQISVIFIIANWPSQRKEHWNILIRARAIENQCYIVGVNRVGTDGNNISYSGGSAVFGPLGEEIYKAESTECLGIAEIDQNKVQHIRSQFPALKDMKLKHKSIA